MQLEYVRRLLRNSENELIPRLSAGTRAMLTKFLRQLEEGECAENNEVLGKMLSEALEEGHTLLDEISNNENIGVFALMTALLHKQDYVVEQLTPVTNINARGPNGITPLMLASLASDLPNVVQKLVDAGANVNDTLQNGTTALILASAFGAQGTVAALIKAEATIEQQATIGLIEIDKILHSLPPTSDANEEMAKILLNNEDNAPSQPVHLTVLMTASILNPPVVKQLLEAGAQIETPGMLGRTALMFAAGQGHLDTVDLLHKHGAALTHLLEDSRNSLILAAQNGHLPVVKFLHAQGCDIQHACWNGTTPLIAATEKNHETVVRFLLEKGANPNAVMHPSKTALMIAAECGYSNIAKLLIEHNADIFALGDRLEYPSDGKKNAFLIAAESGNDAVLELLIEAGACELPNSIEDKYANYTILMVASKNGSLDWVEAILQRIPERYPRMKRTLLNNTDSLGRNALLLAISEGHESVAELLINHGANVNAAHKNGTTALFLASALNKGDIVTILANAGALTEARAKIEPVGASWLCSGIINSFRQEKILTDLLSSKDAKTRYAYTPLMLATSLGHSRSISALLDSGADVNAVSEPYEVTPLLIAVQKNHTDIVSLLCARGANTEARFHNIGTDVMNGGPALRISVGHGQVDTTRALINGGADVNNFSNGCSNLILAVAKKNEAIVTLLLNAGADLFPVATHWGPRGETALSLALKEDGHNMSSITRQLIHAHYDRTLGNRCSRLLQEELCPLTYEDIEKPVSIRRSQSKAVYEMSTLLKWLSRSNTNPMTNECITPLTQYPKMSAERLTFILVNVFEYPMKRIVGFTVKLCLRLKRLSSGRKKYQERILQAAMQRYKERPVVLLQRRFRDKQLLKSTEDQSHQQHTAHAPGRGHCHS